MLYVQRGTCSVQRSGKQWLHLSCWETRINCERAFHSPNTGGHTRRMWNIQQQAADALQCRVASLSRTFVRLHSLLFLLLVTLLPRAVCNYNETMNLPFVLVVVIVAFCAGAVGRGLPSYRYLCCPDNYQLIAIRGGERESISEARQPNPQLIQLQRHLAR